ncbi:hypothetical protein BDR07DRAFT_1378223 [Suillus spraguei]|nr:hypothetical protein BDR07DRAFT_1378223 [Suillus spraguei]
MALNGARFNEAVEHFTGAVNASTFFYRLPIHSTYGEFVALFGWDLKSLWQTANQQQCCAFFRAGSFGAALESYQSIMDKTDEDVKADLRAWFTDENAPTVSEFLYFHLTPRLNIVSIHPLLGQPPNAPVQGGVSW